MGQMGTRRDLGHHATVARMHGLAEHRLGQDAPVGGQRGHGGLVAGAFQADHRPRHFVT